MSIFSPTWYVIQHAVKPWGGGSNSKAKNKTACLDTTGQLCINLEGQSVLSLISLFLTCMGRTTRAR